MNQHKGEIIGVIALLKQMEGRVFMFLGDASNLKSLYAYIDGLHAACAIFHSVYNANIERDVYRKHGLIRKASGVEDQLRSKGLSDEAIVKKLIQLEIEKYEMLLEQVREKADETPHAS